MEITHLYPPPPSVQHVTTAAADDQEQRVCVFVTEEEKRVPADLGGPSEGGVVWEWEAEKWKWDTEKATGGSDEWSTSYSVYSYGHKFAYMAMNVVTNMDFYSYIL